MSTPTDTPDNALSDGGNTMTTTIAEYQAYDSVGLPADKRCDRCGAQALIQVEMPFKSDETGENIELLFCGHHADAKGQSNETHLERLTKSALRIFDYRPFMQKQEGAARLKGDDHA